MIIFRATNFSVIQKIIKTDDCILIEDYIGRIYNFDDVMNSGEVFDSLRGWVQHFFLEEDLAVIGAISEKIRDCFLPETSATSGSVSSAS
jgi:hypothetical protein